MKPVRPVLGIMFPFELDEITEVLLQLQFLCVRAGVTGRCNKPSWGHTGPEETLTRDIKEEMEDKIHHRPSVQRV